MNDDSFGNATPREVAVVLVDNASLSSLRQCLHEVRARTQHEAFDIVVASTRPPPLRNATFTGLRWAYATQAGIGDACNRAVAAIANDVIVLLDSRCRGFDARWLTSLTTAAKQDKRGLVAPPRNDDTLDRTQVVGWGCLAIRRHAFVRDSGFDPSYRDMDCATADLAMRLCLRGLRHTTVDAVPVRLIEGSTIARLLGRRRQRLDRDRLQAAWHGPMLT